jgi:hypothetical protein
VYGLKKLYRKIVEKRENKFLEKMGRKVPHYKGGC